MSDVRIAHLAGRQFNRVSRAQLRALGVSAKEIEHRIACGRLVRVAEGVFAVAPVLEDDWGRWMGATLTAPRTFLSRLSAACAWGILSFEGPRVTVTRPGSGGPDLFSGIQVHRSSTLSGETTTRRGVPITNVPRTLIDLACCTSDKALAKALRDAARLELTALYELGDFLGARGHRRGSRRLARALARYRGLPLERARSGAEIRALEVLRDSRIALPKLNVVIAGEEADLSWAKERLIIEIDGGPFPRTKGLTLARSAHGGRPGGTCVGSPPRMSTSARASSSHSRPRKRRS